MRRSGGQLAQRRRHRLVQLLQLLPQLLTEEHEGEEGLLRV